MPGIFPFRYQFRPGIFTTAATALFVALTVSLGNWQSHRAAEKLQQQERLDALAVAPAVAVPATPLPAGDWSQRRLAARGEFLPGYLILVDNRLRRGVPGYHVVMPLRLESGTMHVLVNRGWVAAGSRRDLLPAVVTPPGVQEIEGIAVVPTSRPYELAPDTGANTGSGPVRQNLVIERIAAETRLALQPVVIQQTSAAPDGLVREWPRPDARMDTNRAYALQWYAMAVVGVLLWLGLNLKKKGLDEK